MENKIKPNVRELALKHGLSFLTDQELIMVILGTGTKQFPVDILSEKITHALNSSNWENTIENLMHIKGVGRSKALAIACALELGKRRNSHKDAKIRSARDILPFVKNYSIQQKEHFLCITLNGSHEIIQIRIVSIGTINRTIVHPREISSEALMENAAAIIVCHNHPSGNCEPSEQDIETTKIIKCSADILGIPLLDHIIFSENNYFSFVENKLLCS